MARVKFISYFIIALCKVQTVGFEKLANAFDAGAKKESSLRRIQRFISGYARGSDLVAKLVFNLLPQKQGIRLSIDRTKWKFGQLDINIFMLGGGISRRGLSIALYNAAQVGEIQTARNVLTWWSVS